MTAKWDVPLSNLTIDARRTPDRNAQTGMFGSCNLIVTAGRCGALKTRTEHRDHSNPQLLTGLIVALLLLSNLSADISTAADAAQAHHLTVTTPWPVAS
jgi:hypothetical protein